MKKVFAVLFSAGMLVFVACQPKSDRGADVQALQDSLEIAAQADSIAAAEQAAAQEVEDSVSADSL